MTILKDERGLVINSILNAGYYVEDGQGYDDELIPNTEKENEIFKKALDAKETVTDADVLEFVAVNPDNQKVFGNWYNTDSGEAEFVYFEV